MAIGIKGFVKLFKEELDVYRAVLRHPETPRLARVLLWLAIGYLCMPFDLIPDWIPVIGLLDDVIIVPALAMSALWMTPPRIIQECRLCVREKALSPE